MNAINPPIQTTKPTKETYDCFQHVYDYLNRSLFHEELPGCLITLQRRKRTYGFFSGNRFAREDGILTDEIALNPAHFRDRPLQEILATLAHEMVHQWQHHFGKSGRGRYHNRQWAGKMKEIGLQPTDTGEEGGKETGDKVHHLVIYNGAFEKTVRRLNSRGFKIAWTEMPSVPSSDIPSEREEETGTEESKSGQRIKYVCTTEDCKQNLRGCSGQMPLCQGNEKKAGIHEPALMVPETKSGQDIS